VAFPRCQRQLRTSNSALGGEAGPRFVALVGFLAGMVGILIRDCACVKYTFVYIVSILYFVSISSLLVDSHMRVLKTNRNTQPRHLGLPAIQSSASRIQTNAITTGACARPEFGAKNMPPSPQAVEILCWRACALVLTGPIHFDILSRNCTMRDTEESRCLVTATTSGRQE